MIEVTGSSALKMIFNHLDCIDEGYKRNLQSESYRTVKKRAAGHNLMIEFEDVLPDKKNVLTLRVR